MNTSAFIVSWCRYFNDTSRMRSLVTEIDINPSDGFHNYKVEFAVKNEEATSVSINLSKELSVYLQEHPDLNSKKIIVHKVIGMIVQLNRTS